MSRVERVDLNGVGDHYVTSIVNGEECKDGIAREIELLERQEGVYYCMQTHVLSAAIRS